MSHRQATFLGILLLLAAAFGWLALRTRQPPLLPADAAHTRGPDVPACLTCHGPDGPSPRGKNHPLGDDCARCHGVPSRGSG